MFETQMDFKYRHPSIQLYIMEQKSRPRCEDSSGSAVKVPESNHGGIEDGESNGTEEKDDVCHEKSVDGEAVEAGSDKVDDWATRRYGAMAARLLRDVKVE